MEITSQDHWRHFLGNLSVEIDSLVSRSGGHSRRVATMGNAIARRLGVKGQALQNIYWGSLLHDIGKIGIPREILLKEGPLTRREWMLMELHPTIGANIVMAARSMGEVVPIIQAHQERYDGCGYPVGYGGEEIPLGARILAVVDTFDAMTDDRPYRKAVDADEALDEIIRVRGSQLDPLVVDVFLEIALEGGLDGPE